MLADSIRRSGMTFMNSETKQIRSSKVILICCDISELGIVSKEPLIKSGSNRLQVKYSDSRRETRVIAGLLRSFTPTVGALGDAEAGYFNRKISIHELIRGPLRL